MARRSVEFLDGLLVASGILRYPQGPAPLKKPTFHRAVLALVLIAAASLAVPARADTRSDLQAARARLSAAQSELRRLAAAWQRSEARLAMAQDAEARARRQIAELEAELREAQELLGDRAAEMFMAGGSPTFAIVLTSDSVTEVADRWEFASSVAQGDMDLATRVAVQTELLRQERQDLLRAIEIREQVVAELTRQKNAIEAKVSQLEALEAELERKLAAQQALSVGEGGPAGGPPPGPVGTGAVQVCPVNGPNSFTDSFGDPRPGGRTHEGIDLIAARGTPVVATHAGTVHRSSSSIGGLGVVVYHDGSADWTFYTHFDSYAEPDEGSHVSVGDVIGYVGNTGTTVYHLHFEYHPGGGSAVNPYSMLVAVC
jgi:peptidoglycan LD-endopeptidase LytH